MSQQDTESENFGPGSDDPLAPGERQREGYKIFALHKEFGFSDSPSVIGQDVSESDFETSLARRWHTFGGRRIELPPGGATAASPFVCKNVGGLPCIEGLHLQDCIAEGTWGNESPHFGYNLPRLCYEFKTLVRNQRSPENVEHFRKIGPKTL